MERRQVVPENSSKEKLDQEDQEAYEEEDKLLKETVLQI